MPLIQSYNTRAAGTALMVLGGEKLLDAFTQLYTVLDTAERSGHEEGFEAGRLTVQANAYNDGYDSGYADGNADGLECFIDDNSVKVNAHTEGFNFPEGFVATAEDLKQAEESHDWELIRAVAALG